MKNRYYPKVSFIVLVAMFMLSVAAICRAEEITLTTYYPSPYGVYSELRLAGKPTATCTSSQAGLMYYDNDVGDEGLKVCTASGAWQSISGYWVQGDSASDIRNINLTGNVGIGLTNPQARLDVNGLIRTSNNMDAAIFRDVSNTAYYLDLSNAVTSLLTAGKVAVGTLTVPSSKFSVNGNVVIGSGYLSSAAPADGLAVQGDVGIGIAGPSYKLHVVGNVGWSGTLQAGAVPWARLTSFPGSCPAGQFVYAVGGALSCSTPGGGGITINSQTGPAITLSPGSGISISTIAANNIQITNTGGAGGGVTGSGSTNYIPKFTGSASLGNSQIYDSGSYVGIGTTSPWNKLTIGNPGNIEVQNGAIYIKTAYSGSTLQLLARDVRTSNNEDLYLNWDNASGRVVVIGGEGEQKGLYMAGPNGAMASGSYIDAPDYYIRSINRWASQPPPISGEFYLERLKSVGAGTSILALSGTYDMCFLTKVAAFDSGADVNNFGCTISGSGSAWYLNAQIDGNTVQCAARCVNF